MGYDFCELSSFTHFKKTTLNSVSDRIHPILLATLHQQWKHKPRSQSLYTTEYPYIGLLIDTTSIEVFHPKCHFKEAKAYYDKKNRIYTLKKRVYNPNSCSPLWIILSERRDWLQVQLEGNISKLASYTSYLMKTTVEKTIIPTNLQQTRWVILGDKGYLGSTRKYNSHWRM